MHINVLIAIKSIFASFLFRHGVLKRKLDRLSRSNYIILAYHRVLPHDEAIKGVQAGMYVTPATFNMHLKYLKENYNIIELKKIAEVSDNALVCSPAKPVCVLTFDDGWKVFYDFAFPLLCRYQLPATVFLPTEFIGTNNKFWTDRFAHILYHRRAGTKDVCVHPDISDLIYKINGLQGIFEKQLERGIAILKQYPLQIVEKVIRELTLIWSVELIGESPNFVDWDEIHEMLDSGLISFGSHTAGHQILTTLEKPDIEKELSTSRRKLLDHGVVDTSFIPFCYPNGNYSQEIATMVCNAGYHMAVTTQKGWNRFEENMFILKRIGIHQDVTSTIPLFSCRLTDII